MTFDIGKHTLHVIS